MNTTDLPELDKSATEDLAKDTRKGILFLCLLKDRIDLFQLSELVGAHETVDDLMQLPFIQVDQHTIWLEESVIATLLGGFRWSEQVRAAEELAVYFHGKSRDVESVGDLWLMAGKKKMACEAFLKALDRYRQEQSYRSAIRTGQKLLRLDTLTEKEEVKVLNSLTEGYECCGLVHEAIRTRKSLLEKPVVKENRIVYASITRALAIDYAKQGSWSHYKTYRKEAALLFREMGRYEESVVEFLALTNRGIDEINLSAALEFANEAMTDAHHAGKTELICKAQAMKAYVMAMSGEGRSAHTMAEEALQLALRKNLLEAAAWCYRKLAGTYEYSSDYTQAKVVYQEALRFCRTEKMDTQTQMCHSCLSWILLRLGEWKKAIEVSLDLIRDPAVNNPSKATAHCVIAIIKSLRGELRSAEKHTLEGIFLSQKEQFQIMYHILHLPMARTNELKGDLKGAGEWYRKIVDEWHLTREKHDILLSLMDAALFFEEQRDRSGLRKCLEIFSVISSETGNNEALGCMAYGLGLKALMNGQSEQALCHFAEAREYIAPLNIPYQTLLIDYLKGKSLLQQKESEKAGQVLLEVLGQAKLMGLAPFSSKIISLITPLKPERSYNEELLTGRQKDVLTLLAQGLSNKEIATRLSRSTRTVDMHLRHLFDRLGCHTRWEAVEKGRLLGLV